MNIAALLPGMATAGIIGAYIGNFATNPIYRLPRDEAIFIRDPYCGDCNHRLVRKDLYPVVSWLLTRGKCRYCGAAVPGLYAVTEAFVGLLFILCYLQYGFTEKFLLISLGLTSYVMLAMMLLLDNFLSNKTLIACMVFGMLLRTLSEGSIYGFAGGGFAALMVSAAVWKWSGAALVRDVKSFPGYLKLLVAAGVWLPLSQLVTVMAAAGLGVFLRKGRPLLVELIIIICSMLLVLIRI